MAFVIKHALRAGSGTSDREGWHPRLSVTLMGPSPAGAQLVWTLTQPDGSPWFTHEVDAPELADGELGTVDLRRWESGTDIPASGSVPFTLRLVSELDGVDELLHDGALEVVEAGGAWIVDFDWLLPTALVGLDSTREADGPRLKVITFLKGDVSSYQLEAHLFQDGTRGAQASDVSTGHTFTDSVGNPVGQEVIAEFDDVRGWNNLAESGWGGGAWHLLDAHDGAYEVKVLREKKVARVVPFHVSGGRIVETGSVEMDRWHGPVMITTAQVSGTADGDIADGSPFYGDAATAALPLPMDVMYADRVAPAQPDPDALDPEVAEGVQRYVDRVERLFYTWASTIESDEEASVPQLEAIVSEMAGVQELYDALPMLPDAHPITVCGVDTTIGDAYLRWRSISQGAQARIDGVGNAAQAVLAPYRAVLKNDKLAVFEDHPAPDFLYYTSNKKVIETPEELAAATWWYFEGALDSEAHGTVDGMRVDVRTAGWRVLGWKFDGDGNTLDEVEDQGSGSSAPKSAFKHS